jgi:hypothetical protein
MESEGMVIVVGPLGFDPQPLAITIAATSAHLPEHRPFMDRHLD